MKWKLLVGVFFIMCQASFSQNVIRGNVIDKETHLPISNGTIRVLGAPIGSYSKENGEFELEIEEEDEYTMISFSCVGYKTKTILSARINEESITVELVPKIIYLEEVIVPSITENSRNVEKLLKGCLAKMRKKCPAFEALATSSHFIQENGSYTKFESSRIKIFDPVGYGKKRSPVSIDEQVNYLSKVESLDFTKDRVNFQRSYFDFYFRPFSYLLKNGLKYDFGSDELIYTLDTLSEDRLLITALDVERVANKAFIDQFDMKFYLISRNGELVINKFELNYSSKHSKKGLEHEENSLFTIKMVEKDNLLEPELIEHFLSQVTRSPKNGKENSVKSYHKIDFNVVNFQYKKMATADSRLEKRLDERHFLENNPKLVKDLSRYIPLQEQFVRSKDQFEFEALQDSISLVLLEEIVKKSLGKKPIYLIVWDGWDSVLPLRGLPNKYDFSDIEIVFMNTQSNKEEWMFAVSGVDYMFYPHFNLASNWKDFDGINCQMASPQYILVDKEGKTECSVSVFPDTKVISYID